ncbi:MAG: pimeloyl-ACP methyl ester carboxylesterase [Hyphomicrobiaceae bacterium]|jgi:pimeloyl-ACP methyl ester carboxylesterase
MTSYELKTVTIHGHEVGYRRAGQGPAILLIHGMAGSSRTWEEVIPLLARNHTVIAPDLLGHGESAKPLGDYSLGSHASGLRDMLAILGIERATIVGQSLGGGVAMQLAYQHPELAERLVLVGSGGLGQEVSWMIRLFSLPGSEYLMPLIFPSFIREQGDKLAQWFKDQGWSAPHLAEIWRAYTSLAEPENRHAFVRTLRAVVDPWGQAVSATDRLYLTGGVPVLIVWGDKDRIIPVAHAYAAHEAMPGSRLEIVENAGHFVHVEKPVWFADLLTEFVDTTEAATASFDGFRELLLGDKCA